MSASQPDFDVCIVGGGSAGIGAACQAAQAGARTLLIEKLHRLGGTAVNSWVVNWEPTPGASGLAKRIWETMLPYHPYPPAFPYQASLKSFPTETRHNLQWPPDLYLWAVEKILSKFDNLQIMTGATFTEVVASAGNVEKIVIVKDSRQIEISAKVFIDASADGNLCAAAGCKFRLGEDGKEDFNEPHAPENPQRRINACDLIYCVQYMGGETSFRLPDDVEQGSCDCAAHVDECPEGIRYINCCGMMEGIRWWDGDRGVVLAQARRKVFAHFDYFRRTNPYYRQCRFLATAPQVGVRETRRIECEYMLNENDILAGWDNQSHNDMIAMTDHELDIHGQTGLHSWLETPYGIPFRSLIPAGYENLLIVGRCAGFSHIAASSCRLSRTMMALGEAGGLAAAMMAQKNCTSMELGKNWWKDKLDVDDRDEFIPVNR